MTTAKEWARRVREWKASGESAEQFGGRHGWKAPSLRWWSWQLNRSKGKTGLEEIRLVPVIGTERQAPPVQDGGAVVLELRGGHRVRLEPGFNEQVLRRVLSVMEAQ
jgi:hypothetical protein